VNSRFAGADDAFSNECERRTHHRSEKRGKKRREEPDAPEARAGTTPFPESACGSIALTDKITDLCITYNAQTIRLMTEFSRKSNSTIVVKLQDSSGLLALFALFALIITFLLFNARICLSHFKFERLQAGQINLLKGLTIVLNSLSNSNIKPII